MHRAVIVTLLLAVVAPTRAQRPLISTNPETPFKLATFQAEGKTRLGLALGERILDIESAHTAVVQELGLRGTPSMPRDMRSLIEDYEQLAPHLYRIANRFKEANADSPAFAFRVDRVAILAPIKYPYNLLAAAAADQEKEDPVFFAKSPRSCIIDPDEPYVMPPGRNIDWEGELAIVIGKQALNISTARAHDYVFGYSVIYDVSDRGGQGRPLTGMFPGPNWFSGKSRDKSAPFGPFIVPKEFAPNPPHFHIVTKVNGVVKQDGNTANLIWDEAHMVRYLSSILTLYPGDVISSGTPDGVGAGRRPPEFLKPGDVVTIEIEGIGTLRTPMKASS